MNSVFLELNHIFIRTPGGNVEDVQRMANAGFGIVLVNIGDHDPSEWTKVRERASAAGVICGPWLRTDRIDGRFSPEKVNRLIAVADEWDTPFCVNSESELQGTGAAATGYIADAVGERDAAISMEPWPYDTVQWTELAHLPIMPQLSKAVAPYNEPGLRDIWRGYGCPCVVLTFGSFGGSVGTDYDRLSPYGVYTADDCGGNYAQYSPQGHLDPCQNGGTVPPDTPIPAPSPGEKIGTEHGITALIDWVQQQPGVPKRGPGYDPKKPGTWPWPERIERTLRILAQDHDS